jgi:hypothetical protein
MMDTLSGFEKFKIKILGAAEKHRAKRCWLFHAWGRWAEYERQYSRFHVPSREWAAQADIRQKRQCLNCGLTQDKIVRRMID